MNKKLLFDFETKLFIKEHFFIVTKYHSSWNGDYDVSTTGEPVGDFCFWLNIPRGNHGYQWVGSPNISSLIPFRNWDFKWDKNSRIMYIAVCKQGNVFRTEDNRGDIARFDTFEEMSNHIYG